MRFNKPSNRAPGSKFSKGKANAIGFAKRQSRKVKVTSGSTNLTDIYEYQPEKNRRANVSLSLGKDEKIAFNVDDEDEDGETSDKQRSMKIPRLIGEDGEDDVIRSDDDEEIDSDDAFEEGDDERFAGFEFSKKKKSSQQKPKRNEARPSKKVRIANVDLNESNEESTHTDQAVSETNEEEEEEEGDPDEFIDILEVLDGKGLPYPEDDEQEQHASLSAHNKPPANLPEENMNNEDEESEDEDENEDDESPSAQAEEVNAFAVSDDEGVNVYEESALDQLDKFISNLDTGVKRKVDDTEIVKDNAKVPAKKRKRLTERTEGGPENEFGVKASDSTKLSLDDLLQPLASQSETLISLKKSTKVLASSSNPKNKPLAAPLPQRTQERLHREAAYEQTKEEVEKWNDAMKRIKEAEHLSFPLQPRTMGNTSNLELAAKFKPTTELEKSIDSLLKSAKLREEDIANTEDLKMNHLSVEEVAERRAELRKMRDLMYRSELKAKRVAKIKSKTYRRIRRKEMEKLSGAAAENANDEDEEEARLRKETERARERATLRHKNTGKWAKALKLRGELDADQRRDINEMLDQGERLRRRIHGEASEDESQVDDDESIDGEGGISSIKANAFEELSRIRDDGDLDLESANSNQKPGKSIFDMKFMKTAAERQQLEVNQIMDDFEKEIGHIPDDDGVGGDEEMGRDQALDDRVDGSVMSVRRTGGRVVYQPGKHLKLHVQQSASQVSQISDDASTLKSSEPYLSSSVEVPERHEISTSTNKSDGSLKTPLIEPNPWLMLDSSSSKVARKRNEVVIGKDSNAAEKSVHMLNKRKQKTAKSREKMADDAKIVISTDNVLTMKNDSGKTKPKKSRPAKISTDARGDDDSDDSEINSELEEQELALTRSGKGIKGFQQRDLVARAFANDNVVQEFEDIKRREVASDAPKEVDTTLPGWGSWGGTGTKRAPARPHLIKKIPGIDPTSRADYNKAHVIISEKKDKKASKYMIKDLPYPYTSKAQFEQSMDTPLGTEWNTRVGFQRGTLPKVVKKMGTVIDPVQRLF